MNQWSQSGRCPVGKLVRDRIPEVIRQAGGSPEVRILDEDEYMRALLDKLREECDEAVHAAAGALLEELGDVFEVLQAIAAASGHTWSQVEEVAATKRTARG